MAVSPDTTAEMIDKWDSVGVVGLRLSVGNLPELPDFNSPEFSKLFKRVRDLDWHVHVYAKPDHTIRIVDTLLSAGVKLVLDHFGARDATCGEGSAVFEAVLRALDTGRAWVKLSAPYWSMPLPHAEIAQRFLNVGGAEHLLWGSDWPFTKINNQLDYQTAIDWLSEWIRDPSDRAAIDRAAASLYRVDLP